MSNLKAVVLFIDGFEEIEAITPVDVLRRAGIVTLMVGITSMQVTGSHGIVVNMDCLLKDIISTKFDLLVLPGGMPGAHHLRDNAQVIQLVKEAHSTACIIGAICAAPVVLAQAGILTGKKVSAYPSKQAELSVFAQYSESTVETDGNIITARGAGCSLLFSFALLKALGMSEKASELQKAMIANF